MLFICPQGGVSPAKKYSLCLICVDHERQGSGACPHKHFTGHRSIFDCKARIELRKHFHYLGDAAFQNEDDSFSKDFYINFEALKSNLSKSVTNATVLISRNDQKCASLRHMLYLLKYYKNTRGLLDSFLTKVSCIHIKKIICGESFQVAKVKATSSCLRRLCS